MEASELRQRLVELGFRFNQHEIGLQSKYNIRVILSTTPYKMIGNGEMLTFTDYETFKINYNKLRSRKCASCG